MTGYTNHISTNIKYLRLKKKMLQRELADKLGMTETALSYYENGKRQPTTETLYELSQIFNLPIHDLIVKDLRIGDIEYKEEKEELTPPQAKIKIEEIIEMTSDLSDQEKMLLRGTLELICKDKGDK